MSRNGSGTYTLPAGNPVVPGTTITTSWANTTLTDIASSLTGSVAADGQTPMTGALNMANNKVSAVTDPTLAQDAATKNYTDTAITGLSATYLAKANNLSDVANTTTSRTNLGLGTIATQAASAVAVTGGAIDGTTVGTTTRSSVKATTLDLGLSTQSVAIGQGNSSLMKNRIINGAMVISQRGTSFTQDTTGTQYSLDRWNIYGTVASKFTVTQSSTAPVGFINSLLVTSSSAYSVGATDQFLFVQAIEGLNCTDLAWGTANAKTVTLSFGVQSSLTGTFGGSLINSAQNRCYPFSYTISSANTWTNISVTIAGDTTGTWLTTNGAGIRVAFSMGMGSTYSGTANTWTGSSYIYAPTGSTSVVGTSGATFYITGVQLEVGSSATGFEYRQYQQELALCQRYYEKIGFGDANSRYPILFAVATAGAYPVAGPIGFSVVKRAIPTLVDGTPSLSNCTSAIDGSTVNGFRMNATSTTSGNTQVTYTTSGITASAEL